MTDWKAIRAEYPIFEERVYLQTNSGGPASRGLIQETTRLLTELSLWGGEICPQWDTEVTAARSELSTFLKVTPEEVAFIPSTSYAMNMLAHTLPATGRILTFANDFPNSFLPWLNQGFKVDYVDSDHNGFIDLNQVEAAITPETKILICSQVMFQTGFRQNLEKLGAICKAHGILFIVDSTQAFGVFPVDIQACQIDVLVFHAYKWLGAGFGIGGMYINQKHLSSWKKPFVGFNTASYSTLPSAISGFEIKPSASAHELGKSPYLNILMFRYMLKQIVAIGPENITARMEALADYFIQRCKATQIQLTTSFPLEYCSGIFNVRAPGVSKEALKAANIIARASNNVVTAGISYYNNEQDLDILLDYLKSHQ